MQLLPTSSAPPKKVTFNQLPYFLLYLSVLVCLCFNSFPCLLVLLLYYRDVLEVYLLVLFLLLPLSLRVLLALGSVYVWPPLGAVTGLALFSAYFESRALEHALLGATLLLYLLRFFVPAERAQAPMFLLWVLEGASLAWVATL